MYLIRWLDGKAVHIKGFDIDGEEWDRVFLVNFTDNEYINLTDRNGKKGRFHKESFSSSEDDDLLKITILEAI